MSNKYNTQHTSTQIQDSINSNQFFEVLTGKSGWYTIEWNHNGNVQKVHGLKNLHIMVDGLLVASSIPNIDKVKDSLKPYVTQAYVNDVEEEIISVPATLPEMLDAVQVMPPTLINDDDSVDTELTSDGDIVITKDQSSTIEADRVAAIEGSLNVVDQTFKASINDADVIYELIDEVEECLEYLQEYQQEQGASRKLSNALAHASKLHNKLNQRLAALDESDNDFLDRITAPNHDDLF